MNERQDIKIDYCSQCRSVWLDRGELDKAIERSSRDMAAWAGQPRHERRVPGDHCHDPSLGRGDPKRPKSFLEELFD